MTYAWPWDKKATVNEEFIRRLSQAEAAEKSKWRNLKIGMTKPQVRVLLGEPERVVNHGHGSTWRYLNKGPVSFSIIPRLGDTSRMMAEKRFTYQEEQVSGWVEPDWVF